MTDTDNINDLELQKFLTDKDGNIGVGVAISYGEPNTPIPVGIAIEDLEQKKFTADGKIRIILTNE